MSVLLYSGPERTSFVIPLFPSAFLSRRGGQQVATSAPRRRKLRRYPRNQALRKKEAAAGYLPLAGYHHRSCASRRKTSLANQSAPAFSGEGHFSCGPEGIQPINSHGTPSHCSEECFAEAPSAGVDRRGGCRDSTRSAVNRGASSACFGRQESWKRREYHAEIQCIRGSSVARNAASLSPMAVICAAQQPGDRDLAARAPRSPPRPLPAIAALTSRLAGKAQPPGFP